MVISLSVDGLTIYRTPVHRLPFLLAATPVDLTFFSRMMSPGTNRLSEEDDMHYRRLWCFYHCLLCSARPHPRPRKKNCGWHGPASARPIARSGSSKTESSCRNRACNRKSLPSTPSPTVLQALLADEIDAASISVTTLTSSRLAGADTVMIVGVVPTFVDHIISVSSITAVEQLKGKTGGVNRLGTTSDLGLRLAFSKLGYRARQGCENHSHGRRPQNVSPRSQRD